VDIALTPNMLLILVSRDHATSSIRIDDDYAIYDGFMTWISAQHVTEVSRDFKVSSYKPSARDDDSDDDDESNMLNENGFFDYEKWSSTAPVYYEPNFGVDSSYHYSHYLQFETGEKENKYNRQCDKWVGIRCMGRST
jgi:chaperone BCS1